MAGDYLKLIKPWIAGATRELVKTRIFTLYSREWRSATDPKRGGDFVFLVPDAWVNVIALTPDRRVVMVEQFRYGTGRVTLETPGGIVDKGEVPADTCRRELLEETGYTGGPVRMIGRMDANPAMQTNSVHVGLMESVALSEKKLAQDEHEEIAVRLVPLAEVPGLIRNGIISHSFVISAFHFLRLAGIEGA